MRLILKLMIKFKSVEINNFRAFGHAKVDLYNQGLVMVLGNNKDTTGKSSNGASKSSIFYAILWALYGKIPDSSSSNSVINEKVGKNTSVFLNFEVNKSSARIERYRKDKTNNNKVLFFIDDKEVTKPTNKATDSSIVDFMGISMDTMLNSIMFGSSRVVDFVSATDKQRKEILEELSNVSIYREAQNRVKEVAKDANTSLLEKETALAGIEAQNANLTALEASYNAQKAQHEDTVNELKNKLADYKAKLLTEDKVESIKNSINRGKAALKKLDDSNKVDPYRDISKPTQKVSSLKSNLTALKNKYTEIVAKIKEDKQEIINLKNTPDAICRLCGNKLDEAHKKKELVRLTNEIKETVKSYNESKVSYKKYTDELVVASGELKQVQDYNLEKRKEQSAFHSKYNKVKDCLQQLKSSFDNYNRLKELYDNIRVQYENEKNKTINRPKELDVKVEDTASLKKEIKKAKDNINDYKELVKIFGDKGVKSHVLSLAIPYINSKMEEYMTILSHGSLNAYISREKNADGSLTERLGLTVDSLSSATSYEDLSTGEKKRIAISLNVAFLSYLASKIGGINISVFDEVFDSLDESGTNAVIELLKELSKSVGTIFVISHNDDLKYNDNFDKIITVEKENGISKVAN